MLLPKLQPGSHVFKCHLNKFLATLRQLSEAFKTRCHVLNQTRAQREQTSFLEMHFSICKCLPSLFALSHGLQLDFWALAAVQAADGWKCSLKSVCGWWITPYTWPRLHTRHSLSTTSQRSPVRHLRSWNASFEAFCGARWPKAGNAVNSLNRNVSDKRARGG